MNFLFNFYKISSFVVTIDIILRDYTNWDNDSTLEMFYNSAVHHKDCMDTIISKRRLSVQEFNKFCVHVSKATLYTSCIMAHYGYEILIISDSRIRIANEKKRMDPTALYH